MVSFGSMQPQYGELSNNFWHLKFYVVILSGNVSERNFFQFRAILFFLMLLSLGLGTQFSIMETITRIVVDAWPGRISHRTVLTVACSLMCIGGISMTTNGGMYVLQLMDNHAGRKHTPIGFQCLNIQALGSFDAWPVLESLQWILAFNSKPGHAFITR